MPNCTADWTGCGRLGRPVIEANFRGGAIASGGGVMLLRQMDRKIGLSAAAAAVMNEPRAPERIRHELHDLVVQGLYALCCGCQTLTTTTS
jgi:Transposase DDE domain group 1